MDNDELKQNVRNKTQWSRLLYMLVFMVVLYIVMMLVAVVVLVQFVFALFTGKAHTSITDFATDLSRYVYQIVAFLTYSEERKPFPFTAWGSDEADIAKHTENDGTSVERVRDVSDSDDDLKPSH